VLGKARIIGRPGGYGGRVTEVPDADRQEQSVLAIPDDEDDSLPTTADDVPEADALEQSRAVPLDEDYE
jgi:hypothetical protein